MENTHTGTAGNSKTVPLFWDENDKPYVLDNGSRVYLDKYNSFDLASLSKESSDCVYVHHLKTTGEQLDTE